MPVTFVWIFTVINICNISFRAGMAHWVWRLRTDVLQGPGNETYVREIFRKPPDRLWGPPNHLCNGYSFFPEDKSAGAWP